MKLLQMTLRVADNAINAAHHMGIHGIDSLDAIEPIAKPFTVHIPEVTAPLSLAITKATAQVSLAIAAPP